jgi:hypothetical protein
MIKKVIVKPFVLLSFVFETLTRVCKCCLLLQIHARVNICYHKMWHRASPPGYRP